jgi:Dyp-type peroxidase family
MQTMHMRDLELYDVQGIVIRGYGHLHAAAFPLLRIVDPGAARAWLATLAGTITSALRKPQEQAVNVAFTFPGLVALGLGDRAEGFAPEFIEGIAPPPVGDTIAHRSRILGDAGKSRPATWLWGAQHNEAVHVLLMLYARDDGALERLLDDARRAWQPGLSEVTILPTNPLPDRFGIKEHFGFRDGISQPAIAAKGIWAPADRGGVLKPDRAENTVAPGEFIFGYTNEYGQLPASPIVRHDPTGILPRHRGPHGFALGRNGTYLVVRQLQQLVYEFWKFVHDTVGPERGVWLASKMVGRWPSGAPLVMSPDGDPPGLEHYRGFDYARADPFGHACPLGAHIRRANPRDALLTAGSRAESIKETKRHRLIRRGRTYGPPLVPSLDPIAMMQASDDHVERGLHFICVCSDIERQFELIQHTWLGNPKFGGLYGNPDPLFGDRIGNFHSFFEPEDPVRRRWTGLNSFVRTRGGGYFFLPGIQALRYLGAMAPYPSP